MTNLGFVYDTSFQDVKGKKATRSVRCMVSEMSRQKLPGFVTDFRPISQNLLSFGNIRGQFRDLS